MFSALKPGLTLFAVSAIAALALSFTYMITEKPIEAQNAAAQERSRLELLPDADTFEEMDVTSARAVTSALKGKADGRTVGYVIGISVSGYGGVMDMLVGVDDGNAVTGVKIMNHSETPGLGANASQESFTDKYKGKTGPFTVTKSVASGENEIDAITSATITTTAVTDGVNAAVEFAAASARGDVGQ
ncbi:MAG: RnfABCDGE type electron transport complex subunit G [Clostridiales bacterium]|jgi:electron transport complex protein RnfG|nr:RnfABCDGE type electron transport complex subunit G [Clostridiales bacterium]